MDVGAWLRGLGLERYEQAFRDNAIDAEILPDLTEADLEKIGVLLGHRKKLLRVIAELREPFTKREAIIPARPVGGLPAREPVAERRQLTVLFCDLVGSTALSGRLDPEDMREVISGYHRSVAEVVERYEGYVAKYLGDSVLAYFGYPQAHEDDAERAVRAGLGIVETVGRLAAPDDGGTPLAARVGIATGLVVVGELIGYGEAQERAAIGETPNLAARLQALAMPGNVVIGPTTRRLVGSLFELADLGVHDLKGFAAPVPAWHVLGPGATQGRFEARRAAGLTPLVGREAEVTLLLARWKLARERGKGEVVLIAGEPGIGKSRLIRTLCERLNGERHAAVAYQCSPYHTHSALHPAIEQLEHAAGFERDDSAALRLTKLETLLARSTRDHGAVAPLLAALLAIPTGDRYPPLNFTPQRQKEAILQALVDQLEGLAAGHPVLVALEDAHWIDPTTQELFGLIIDRVRDLCALVVITFRPEFIPPSPWLGHTHVTLLTLNRLSRRQGAALVERVTGGEALPAEVVAQIVSKTDGVPLFVEELTKAVLEPGLLREEAERYAPTGPLAPLAIPATLQDSLMARLDRLAPVKEVAQVGAVIGREFSHELLAAMVPLDGGNLEAAVTRLVDSGIVFRRGTPPKASYSFKHALIRDAAYDSLLRSRRRLLHERLARAFEQRFPEMAEVAPELLAHHYTEAGLARQAIGYWICASRCALHRAASAEAVGHLSRGLALLEGLPEPIDRQRTELELQLLMGDALRSAKHLDSQELERAYDRARELCKELGEFRRLIPVLYGQYVISFNRARLATAKVFVDELLRLAQVHADTAAFILGHQADGSLSFTTGNLVSARSRLEHALACPGREQYRADFAETQYPSLALTYLSWTLLALGYPDQASTRSSEALAEAGLGSLLTVALALDNSLCLDQLRRDNRAIKEHTDALGRIAAEIGNSFFLARAKMFCGWMLVAEGQTREGIAFIQEAAENIRKVGSDIEAPLQLTLLAEAYRISGDAGAGLRCIDDALARADNTGERWYEADLHRLRGDMIASRAPSTAETCYRQAIEIARNQSAKSWELRAVTSLARLWRDQGKRAVARDLLAAVYGWFTEGFDTPDLKDAKALLDELR